MLINSSTNDAVQSNKNKALCRLHNMRLSRWCERNILYTGTRLPGLVWIWTYNVSEQKSVGFINKSVQLVYLNPLKPSGYYMYHSPILRSAHTVYLCVLCGSQNKAIISLYSNNWSDFVTERACLLRGTSRIFNKFGFSSWKVYNALAHAASARSCILQCRPVGTAAQILHPARQDDTWSEWDTKLVPNVLSTSDVKVNTFVQGNNIFTQKRFSVGVL